MVIGHAHAEKLYKLSRLLLKKELLSEHQLWQKLPWPEKIMKTFKSIEKVRLVSSGTEAVMTAIRLARAFTKRGLIIKMSGCYHGHSDSLLVAAGSGLAESGNSIERWCTGFPCGHDLCYTL